MLLKNVSEVLTETYEKDKKDALLTLFKIDLI